MALARNLHIYTEAIRLLTKVYQTTAHFPRDYRPSVGRQMEQTALTIRRLIVRANRKMEERTDSLDEIIEACEEMHSLTALARDLQPQGRAPGKRQRGLVSIGEEAALERLITNVSRQATGWQRATIQLAHTGSGLPTDSP